MLKGTSIPAKRTKRSQHPILHTAEHFVGVGLGAAGGIAVGAVLGAVAGPPGMVVGALGGAVAGGVAGEAVVEFIDDERLEHSDPRFEHSTDE